METTDQQRFFESDAQQAKREARHKKEDNTFGNPIRLSSKALAVIPDPTSPHHIFVAESGGRVCRINTETRTTTAKYTGPSAPVTSLTVGGPDNATLFAGSWDKTVWSWDIATRKPLRRYDGHSDFVKTVVGGRLGSDRHIVISGGADKKILVWDVSSGRKLYTLQDPETTMMALQSLAVDPVLSTPEALVVVSASSDPHIRRWKVRQDGGELIAASETEESTTSEAAVAGAAAEQRQTIQEHETSVYKVLFDVAGDEADLWTASADGTAKCLSRERGFTADDAFEHGNFVKGLAVTEPYVVTGGFSQDVKVWDRTSGKLLHTIPGHFDEITDFAVLKDASGRKNLLCSVSIDRTVRTWPLDKEGLDGVEEEIRKASDPEEEDEDKGGKTKDGGMTADEEAELAALMEDD